MLTFRTKHLSIFIVLLGILIFSPRVGAHVLKTSSSELKIDSKGAQWTLFVHEGDFDRKFKGVPDEVVKNYLAKNLRIKRGEKFCPATSVNIQRKPQAQGVYFTLNFECEDLSGDITVFYNLFYGDWNHRHLARILWNGNVKSYSFSSQNTQLLLSAPSVWEFFWAFFRLGLEHILIGYDHILFLFTLILGARRFSHLIWLVTTFTLAHSLSLALATLNYVQLSPQVVEPAIAASIVILALLDFWTPVKRETRGMIPITFMFGLIHGLGFSGILKESGIQGSEMLVPLLSFNLGVEAGQILIVSLVYGLVVFLKRQFSLGYPVGRKVVLGLIALIGLYWFVIRL